MYIMMLARAYKIMQGEMKMKEDDNFVTFRTYRNYLEYSIFTAEKISKDGKKVRTLDNRIFNIDEKPLVSMQMLKKKIKESLELIAYNGCRFFIDSRNDGLARYGFIYAVTVVDDDFDETVHIDIPRAGFTLRADSVKHNLAEIRCPKFEGWLAKDIDSIVTFFERETGFPIQTEPTLLEKFNKWQEKYGYGKTDEFWKDYKGGTEQLEWAIDNNIHCADFDRWQCVQRILRHSLDYETAKEIFKTLYERELIEIFDCE